MDPKRFNNLMTELGLSIGRDFSAEERVVWLRKLSDLSDVAIEAALDRASRECKAFPSVALIREFAAAEEYGETSSNADVWPHVLKAVHRFGLYGKAEARAAIPRTVWLAIGGDVGWEHLCDMEPDQRTHFAAQFRDRYRELRATEDRNRRLPEHLRPAIDNTPVAGLPEPQKELPALPAPAQPTEEQIERAKTLRIFRDPVEATTVSEEELERRRAAQIESAQRMIRNTGTESA